MERYLGIHDEDRWYTVSQQQKQEVLDKLLEKGDTGIFIDAPKVVRLQKHATIPVYGFRTATGYNAYHYPTDKLLLIFLNDIRKGELFCEPAIFCKETPPDVILRPESDFLEGIAAEHYTIDIGERLRSYVFSEGTITLGMLLFNQASNLISVALRGADGIDKNSDYEILTPRYFDCIDNFSQESNEGNHLSVDVKFNKEVYARNTSDNVTADITFSLQPNTTFTCTNVNELIPEKLRSTAKYNAFIRVFILLTGYDTSGPWITPVDIPVSLSDKKAVCGKAQIDLTHRIPRLSQKYAAWAIVGNVISSPSVIDIAK